MPDFKPDFNTQPKRIFLRTCIARVLRYLQELPESPKKTLVAAFLTDLRNDNDQIIQELS